MILKIQGRIKNEIKKIWKHCSCRVPAEILVICNGHFPLWDAPAGNHGAVEPLLGGHLLNSHPYLAASNQSRWGLLYCFHLYLVARGLFFKAPEKFSHLKSCCKISNLMTTELFYAHILKMNGGSLHTGSFRRIHLSVSKYQLTKNGFAGLKSFQGFQETGPCPLKAATIHFPKGVCLLGVQL